jgi:hypothetical protein
MRNRFFGLIIFSFCTSFLGAQQVLYSPFVSNQPETRFQVIGKAGNYYWVQKSKKIYRPKRYSGVWDEGNFNFEIYDDRMNPITTIPFEISNDVIKEYLVPGEEYFDQLLFLRGNFRTTVLLNRFAPGGNTVTTNDTLAQFPARLKYSNFLLIRSEDKSRTLLLGFEMIADSLPTLHSFLYDRNWTLLNKTIYTNANISQPYVQYDLVDYPLEHFSNTAVKLANSGEWLMTVPSGINHNFLLFHFSGLNEKFVYREIKISSSASPEEIILSLDNAKQEASTGILSRLRYESVKNVRIAHYLLPDHRIDFDTSFRFNTLANKTKNENLYEEYFMTVPNKGFMLLKEYGKPFSFNDPGERNYERTEADSIFSHAVDVNRNEYTRYGNLAGSRTAFDRGDLSMFYFPWTRNDSCWSGIINKEQTTQITSSYLSYVFLPREDKLFFLYNEFFRNNNQYSNTTVLDQNGNSVEEGVVYWKMKNNLVFQKARQISANELAIPYERNGRNGFAIIRL